jgi:hypothetical protein
VPFERQGAGIQQAQQLAAFSAQLAACLLHERLGELREHLHRACSVHIGKGRALQLFAAQMVVMGLLRIEAALQHSQAARAGELRIHHHHQLLPAAHALAVLVRFKMLDESIELATR